ncbi:MAG: N-acetylglucosamine-6-phosphate deacetylase [Actinomycetota bacterium]|nr:N-acetylglucosamine-6-phosphate deacetylase [Actinomycetota bacterium]
MLISGGTIVTPDGPLENGWLLIEDGLITGIGTGETPVADTVVDARGGWVVPGFVDIHCHGGGGFAFPDAAHQVAAVHARHGTTTLLASLVSRPIPELVRQIASLREAHEDGVIAGVHLEGPFLSAARCGAHDPAILRPPDHASVADLLSAGPVRMVTLAPELDGAVNAVRQLVSAGVIAAIGHTDAVEAQVVPAIDAGATVATHLFNGMRELHHREPGPVGALLNDPRVMVELICDMVHLSPTIVRLAARAAGERTVLVTDAIAAAGAGDGSYEIGGLSVVVTDGVPRLAGGSSLAGSTLTMDVAFRNLVACGLSVPAAVTATSTRPAALLGLSDVTGSLVKGLAADVVVLSPSFEPVTIVRRGDLVS